VPQSSALTHVAMSVPPGTLTPQYCSSVLEFYGELLGWQSLERFRQDDRLMIGVGPTSYVNLRERDDAHPWNGYDHFGVQVKSADQVRSVADAVRAAGIECGEISEDTSGALTFRFRHLLPYAIEVQHFPDR